MRQLKITKSITNRKLHRRRHLQDIGKGRTHFGRRRSNLSAKNPAGRPAGSWKIVQANLRFVVSVAKQYQNWRLSLPDLINEGNLGLIKAAQRFDETRGFKFISYAVWWIRQSILQALAEQSRIVRLPLNQVGLLNKIKKESSRLEQKFERPLSWWNRWSFGNSWIQDRCCLENINKVCFYGCPLTEDEDMKLIDIFVDEDAPVTDAGLMRESLAREIQRSLSTLTEKERDVVNLYYGIGMNHGLTLEDICRFIPPRKGSGR